MNYERKNTLRNLSSVFASQETKPTNEQKSIVKVEGRKVKRPKKSERYVLRPKLKCPSLIEMKKTRRDF